MISIAILLGLGCNSRYGWVPTGSRFKNEYDIVMDWLSIDFINYNSMCQVSTGYLTLQTYCEHHKLVPLIIRMYLRFYIRLNWVASSIISCWIIALHVSLNIMHLYIDPCYMPLSQSLRYLSKRQHEDTEYCTHWWVVKINHSGRAKDPS